MQVLEPIQRPALPEPGLIDWARLLMLRQRLPTERRRLKWRAAWQFDRIVERLAPGDIAIDCGASDGRCVRLFAAAGATVYAFEPDPHGFAALQRMFAGSPNIHLLEQAVGLEARQATLYRNANFGANPDRYVESSSLYVSKVNAADTGMVQVQQIDFPAFLAGLGRRVAILKLDIEGAEVPILERLLDGGLIDRVDWVFAETHERIIPELAERTIALRRRVAHDGLRNVSLDWA